MLLPNFTIGTIIDRVGGTDSFLRVLGLEAAIVRRGQAAVAARVGSPSDPAPVEVMVSTELLGKCSCARGAQGSFCDHMGAAALEWILEGQGREPPPHQPAPLARITWP